MSLDVYLISDKPIKKPQTSGIFIRENGKTVEITEERWRELHPDREPVRAPACEDETNELYHDNITHNLAKMANAAGIYACLWRPDEIGITKAHQLLLPLNNGLTALRKAPMKFKKYNPENGWGDYEGLCEFVQGYLDACLLYRDAKVEVSR